MPIRAAAAPQSGPLISFSGVSKRFGSRWANRRVSFDIQEGEIHAVVGENGAGKSTLMKMLFGHLHPDEGCIFLREKPVALRHPRDAMQMGIGMVHQKLLIFPHLTALENIIIGAEPSKWGWIRRGDAEARVKEICELFSFSIPLQSPADVLSFGQWQQIEIARLLYRESSVLVLDEPTSLLSPPEVEQFLQFLHALRSRGRTILFISHRLKEVFSLADHISILRGGRYIGTYPAHRTSMEEIASLIIAGARGRPEGSSAFPGEEEARGGVLFSPLSSYPAPEGGEEERFLEIRGIDVLPQDHEAGLNGFSLTARKGEILGMGGVVGNGQRTLARALAGVGTISNGRILLQGADVTCSTVEERRRAGIRWLPANSTEEGLMPDAGLMDNLLLGLQRDPRFQKAGWMVPGKIARWAAERLWEYEVAFSGLKARLTDLSGGNQQKVCLARVMEGSPRLVLLEQPGRGLDVRAQERLHRRIRELNENGVTFVLFSHDLDELLALSHRIGILFRGRLMGITGRQGVSPELLGKWMLGVE